MTYAPTTMRRNPRHKPAGNPLRLAQDHPAAVEGRSLFPNRVVWAGFAERVLKSGHNSSKIGREVTRGKWTGYPIYTLTLEERSTCPVTCKEWHSCYGNKMQWPDRYLPGAELEKRLHGELAQLERQHPHGFVVRLHILGDFYSADYVRRWLGWLDRYTSLHVFGYTAWPRGTAIGDLIHDAAAANWARFAIRYSGGEGARTAVTISVTQDPAAGAIACPAQTDKTDCCGTCGLCWGTTKQIAFLRH